LSAIIKRVLIACGTAIATATHVRVKVEELLKKNGVKAEVTQCRVTEVPYFLKTKKTDLILTTSFVPDIKDIPVLNAVSLLTGVGKEKLEKEIVDILKRS